MSDLLGILRITKQSLARVLGALMEQGYVAQSPGRADRRQRLLTLTAAGAALERRLFERQQERLRPAYREAGAAAVDGFRRVLRGIMDDTARAYIDAHHARGELMAEDAHILVVDDDARLRALLSRYLAGEGFRVTTAETATEARDKLRFMHPDMLVLDVMMPGESGLTLTESLRREQGSDVPVLLLTARGAPEDRIAGFEAGADDYLGKPFEPRELVLRIRALLRRAPAPRRSRRAVRCSSAR